MNPPPDPVAAATLASEPDPVTQESLRHPEANGILTVDLDALTANWRLLASKSVPAECAAVVKADAYGCGIEPVTRALSSAGCKTFFVATLDEARVVRKAAPTAVIYVLDGFFSHTGRIFVELECRPVIGDIGELAEWDAFCRHRGVNHGAALHVDTGMNRLGLSIAEAQALIPRIEQGNHGINLVMSHLACAELLDHPLNPRQASTFREVARHFSGVTASLSNSSGIFLGPSYMFDMVRPGAALYGVNPTPEADSPMKPVVDVKARIVQVRPVERGETVGYGATWTARRQTKLAILAAGYADGYFRAAGGVDGVRSAEVIIGGKRCPIAGRISMDLMAVDVTDLPKPPRRGDLATLVGDGITVDALSQHFGTIGYEVLTALGSRYARVYKGGPG
jgi:alanine racemase